MTRCRSVMQDWDGAYLLGALSPAERAEYEQHLTTCPDCSGEVRLLAGMPGLLAAAAREGVTADDGASPAPEHAPDTVLAAALATVARERHRRTWLLRGAASLAAAAAVALVAVLGVQTGAGPAPATNVSATAPRSMVPVGDASGPLRATVAMADRTWGTQLTLHCTYRATAAYPGETPAPAYVLVVRARTGGDQQVGSWTVQPGADFAVTASTALHRSDIGALEIRTSSGQPVLRLTS